MFFRNGTDFIIPFFLPKPIENPTKTAKKAGKKIKNALRTYQDIGNHLLDFQRLEAKDLIVPEDNTQRTRAVGGDAPAAPFLPNKKWPLSKRPFNPKSAAYLSTHSEINHQFHDCIIRNPTPGSIQSEKARLGKK